MPAAASAVDAVVDRTVQPALRAPEHLERRCRSPTPRPRRRRTPRRREVGRDAASTPLGHLDVQARRVASGRARKPGAPSRGGSSSTGTSTAARTAASLWSPGCRSAGSSACWDDPDGPRSTSTVRCGRRRRMAAGVGGRGRDRIVARSVGRYVGAPPGGRRRRRCSRPRCGSRAATCVSGSTRSSIRTGS